MITKVAPLLAGMIGAPAIATGYAATTALLALGQTLPGVIKSIDGLINNGGSKERNTLWKSMNQIEGFRCSGALPARLGDAGRNWVSGHWRKR